jgi:ketosteroid isomerase-like protein
VTDRFSAWIAAYEEAWRTEGTETLLELFTADATYQAAPFDDPLTGLDAIAQFWEDEREGPDEIFTLKFEIVAAQGDTAVARLEVAAKAHLPGPLDHHAHRGRTLLCLRGVALPS